MGLIRKLRFGHLRNARPLTRGFVVLAAVGAVGIVYAYGSSLFPQFGRSLAPATTTREASDITQTTARLSGDSTAQPGKQITGRGFNFGTTASYGQTINDVVPASATHLKTIGASGTAAGQLDNPVGIAVDDAGNIYVAERGNSRVQIFNPAGVSVRRFGSYGFNGDEFRNAIGIGVDADSNITVSDIINNTNIKRYSQQGTFLNSFGDSGSAATEIFDSQDATVDDEGNVYVADTGNNRVQKYNTVGELILSFNGSTGAGGQFSSPQGIALDKDGNIYVADTFKHMVQKFNSAGVYQSHFGSNGLDDGQFAGISDVAVDSVGNIYVADANLSRIQKFNSAGVYQSQFGTAGTSDGQFDGLNKLAVDEYDNVLATDSNNDRIQKFLPAGKFSQGNYDLVVTGLECGTTYHYRATATNADGTNNGEDATFTTAQCSDAPEITTGAANAITQTTVDLSGEVLSLGGGTVSERGFRYGTTAAYGGIVNEAVNATGSYVLSLASLSCGTTYSYRAYATNENGTGFGDEDTFTTLACPEVAPSVSTDVATNVLQKSGVLNGTVTGEGSSRVTSRGFRYGTDTNYGTTHSETVSDGLVFAGQLETEVTPAPGDIYMSKDMVVDSADNVYIVDTYNNQIIKYNAAGEYELAWGQQGTGNGEFNSPWGITADASGNIYVADAENSRIQKFDSNGNFISKWGERGIGNGQFGQPTDIAIDSLGYIYVTEVNEPADDDDPYGLFGSCWACANSRVQKFNPDGSFLQQWGSPGTGDNQFLVPMSIDIDDDDNVFVLDLYLNRVQKFTSNGNFLTKWGSYGASEGQFDTPFGITVDNENNVLVADALNGRIQKFSNSGSQLATWGELGIRIPFLSSPTSVGILSNGDVYVGHASNIQGVYKFTPIEESPSFEHLIEDLPCNTTYHFQAFATNSVGTTYGNDTTLTTADCPGAPSVQTNPASNISLTQAQVNGEILSGGIGRSRVGFEYGTTTDYGQTTFRDTSHDPGLSYSGRVTPSSYSSNIAGNPIVHVRPDYVDGGENVAYTLYDLGNSFAIAHFINGSVFHEYDFISEGLSPNQLYSPVDMALNNEGGTDYVYIADAETNSIKKYSVGGSSIGFVNSWGEEGTGPGQFASGPVRVIVKDNIVYVGDGLRIQKFTTAGNLIEVISFASDVYIPFFYSFAVDGQENYYVADFINSRIVKLSNTGQLITTWGGEGLANGKFFRPYGVAVDYDGRVYVSDTYNNRLQVFDENGVFIEKYGNPVDGLPPGEVPPSATPGLFDFPGNISIVRGNTSSGTESLDTYTLVIGSSGFSSLVGGGTLGFNIFTFAPQLSETLEFDQILGLSCSSTYHYRAYATNTYGTGYGEDQMLTTDDCPLAAIPTVRTDQPTNLSTNEFGTQDATLNATVLSDPEAVTERGFQARTDSTSHVEIFSEEVSKDVAYQGQFGSEGTGNSQFRAETCSSNGCGAALGSMTVGVNGDIYIIDAGNYKIKQFSAAGTFIRAWSISNWFANGWVRPTDIAVDSSGNVYIFDDFSKYIMKFSSTGSYQAAWGGETSTNQDGKFAWGTRVHIAIDSQDNIFAVDTGTSRLQKFSTTTGFEQKWDIAGGVEDINGVGANSIAIDSNDDIFIAGGVPDAIVKLTNNGEYIRHFGHPTSNFICEGSSGDELYIDSQDTVYVAQGCSTQTTLKLWNTNGTFVTEFQTGVNYYNHAVFGQNDTLYFFDGDTFSVRLFEIPLADTDFSFNSVNTNWCTEDMYYRAFVKNAGGDITYGEDVLMPCAPFVQTEITDQITQTTARLSLDLVRTGSVPVTILGWEYGTTTSYGQQAEITSVGFSTGVQQTTISGLTCSTTYHYRAYGENPVGRSVSFDSEFQTASCGALPTVVTGNAEDLRYTFAALNGLVTSQGSTPVVGVGFNYGKTTNYELYNQTYHYDAQGVWYYEQIWPENVIGPAPTFDLECGTTYHYRAFATNSDGTGYGQDETFTTSPCITITAQPATSITSQSAKLPGTLSSQDPNIVWAGGGYGTSPNNYDQYASYIYYGDDYGLGTYGYTEDGIYIWPYLTCGTTYYYSHQAMREELITGYENITGSAVTQYSLIQGSEASFTMNACPSPTDFALTTELVEEPPILSGNDATYRMTLTNVGDSAQLYDGYYWFALPEEFALKEDFQTGYNNEGVVCFDPVPGQNANYSMFQTFYPDNTFILCSLSDLNAQELAVNDSVSFDLRGTATADFIDNETIHKAVFTPNYTTEPEEVRYALEDAIYGYSSVDVYTLPYNNISIHTYSATATENQPPAVAVTEPEEDQHFAFGQSIDLTAEASDSDGAISQVELFLNGEPVGTIGTAPYTVTANGLPAGTHTVTAIATDNDGATTTSASVSFIVDGAAPQVVTSDPTSITKNGAQLNGDVIRIGSANLSLRGFQYGTTTSYGLATSDSTSATGVYSRSLTTLSCGTTYQYRAFATNGVGTSYGSNKTLTTSACTAPPTVVITAPENNQKFGSTVTSVVLAAQATSLTSTIAKVDFYIDGNYTGSSVDPPYQLTKIGLPVGSYTLTTQAFDVLGDTAVSLPVVFYVEPPNGTPNNPTTPTTPIGPTRPTPLAPPSTQRPSSDPILPDGQLPTTPRVQAPSFTPAPKPNRDSGFGDRAFTYLPFWLLLALLVVAILYAIQTYKEYKLRANLIATLDRMQEIKSAVDDFIAITAHILNTPLAILKGSVDLAETQKTIPASSIETLQKNLAVFGASIAKVQADNKVSVAQTSMDEPVLKVAASNPFKDKAVWIPGVVVGSCLIIVNLLFAQLDSLRSSSVQTGLQAALFLLIFGLIVLIRHYKEVLQKTRELIQNNLAVSNQLLEKRRLFVDDLIQTLNKHSEDLQTGSQRLKDTPQGHLYANGMAMLAKIQRSLNFVAKSADPTEKATLFDLSAYLNRTAKDLADKANAKSMTVDLNIADNLSVRARPDQVQQLFESITDNAFKFSKQNGRVDITAKQRGGFIKLEVKDDGLGISEDKMNQLFQPFARGTSSEQFDFDGSGLSLYVNRVIVAKLGGTINVTSKPENGTKVSIKIPSAAKDEAMTAPTLIAPTTEQMDQALMGR